MHFVFFRKFYGIKDNFPVDQLMIRSKEGKKRNIYFASEITKTIMQNNSDRIKVNWKFLYIPSGNFALIN